jgi:hypothetical protein
MIRSRTSDADDREVDLDLDLDFAFDINKPPPWFSVDYITRIMRNQLI